MTLFREIIPIEDDYEVAKAKATIAIRTVQWCHEIRHITHKPGRYEDYSPKRIRMFEPLDERNP